MKMTHRMYIDEVGNGDLHGAKDDDNIRYLSLTGIITSRSNHDKYMTPRMEALKSEFFDHKPSKPVIFHRRDMLNGNGPFSVLKDPNVRAQFDERLLSYLRDEQYIAITVTIDKREHLNRYMTWRYDPYHYCMHCIVERYVMWLKRRGVVGDVAIEARFPKADKRLKKSYRKLYLEGTDFITAKVAQAVLTSRELKIIDKKANWAGLQIADLIAHPSFRAMRLERDKMKAPPDFGTQIVDLLLASKLARNPKKPDVISGWGRKWLPV